MPIDQSFPFKKALEKDGMSYILEVNRDYGIIGLFVSTFDFKAIAKEYERLKLDLWKQYEHDRNMYTSHKGDFVEQYTQKGKLLFTGRYDNK